MSRFNQPNIEKKELRENNKKNRLLEMYSSNM